MTSMRTDPDLQSSWPVEPAGPPPIRRKPTDVFRELPFLVLFAFGLALLMKTFLLQMFYIPSASMEPTLHGCSGCRGDRVAVNKLVYRFRDPRRGEIIVFIAREADPNRSLVRKVRDFLFEGLGASQPTEEDYIKRIIALPGETIRVTRKNVFVTTIDGQRLKLDEPYIELEGDNLRTFGPFKVPKDTYFVMGDNRNNSSDSRVSFPGPIPRDRIIGKAFVKIWPPTRIGLLKSPSYEGQQVPSAAPSPVPAPLLPLPALLVAGVVTGRRARS